MTYHIKFSAISLCSFVACLVPSEMLAQSEEEQEARQDTIIVTGIRQAYRGDFDPLEIPQSDLIIDAEDIANAGAIDLSQALDLSASVARQNNFGGLWNSFALRGFVGDANLPSNYLVNGFNAGRGFAGPRDLSGIENVEILKGPRAALYGRGEPGGTINLVTKRPKFQTQGKVNLTAGSFDFYRFDGDWTSPVSSDVAVRIVGLFEDAGSFRNHIETNKLGLYPSLVYNINPKTRFLYELEYTNQEIPFDRGVVAVENKLGVIPIETFLGEPGNGPMEANVTGHQFELQTELNENWRSLIGATIRSTSLEGYDTAATLSGSRQFLTRDKQNLSRERRFRKYNAEYSVIRGEVSGELKYGTVLHRIIIGADIDRFENDQLFLRARGGGIQTGETAAVDAVAERLQVINILEPEYGRFDLPDPSPLTDRVETQQSLGIFIQDQISFNDQFDLRIGLRFDDHSQELVNRRPNPDTVTEQSDSQVSPQFGIVYKASELISIYAAYGENFRPLSGGLDPNTAKSIEAGLKFNLLEDTLVGGATIFQVQQENISTLNDQWEPTAIGEAESKGLEFDLTSHMIENTEIRLSFAYVDAKTKNEFNDADFNVTIPAGQRMLNIPKQQLSLQVVRNFERENLPLKIGGGLLHVGERLGQFGDFFNQNIGDFELPSYSIISLFGEYELNSAFTVRADIKNLFDEVHYTNSFASLWVLPGEPQSFRLSAAFHF